MAKAKKDDDNPSANPFNLPDLSKMLSQMQVPGLDFEQLMREGQKNIEALQQANQAVAAGWQALAQKQMEIFQQTMQRWQEAGSQGTPAENLEQQVRQGFEQALANMRELAEIAAESQSKAFETMRQRFEESMQSALNKKADS